MRGLKVATWALIQSKLSTSSRLISQYLHYKEQSSAYHSQQHLKARSSRCSDVKSLPGVLGVVDTGIRHIRDVDAQEIHMLPSRPPAEAPKDAPWALPVEPIRCAWHRRLLN